MASMTETASPVNWHAALWVLFSLALNSMAQPSGGLCGIPVRHRLYLCSSPVLIAADALSVVLQSSIVSICLGITPYASMAIVLEHKSSSIGGDTTPSELHRQPSWPRWLLFVMGTLPAAIKLASYSGTPWTQSWGMMLLSSFIITELVTTIGSQTETSTLWPEDLPTTFPRVNIRETLLENMARIDFILLSIATLTHLGVAIWAFDSLMPSFFLAIRKSNLFEWIRVIMILVLTTSLLLGFSAVFVLRTWGHVSFQERWLPLNRLLNTLWFGFMLVTILIPRDENASIGIQRFERLFRVDFFRGGWWAAIVVYIFRRCLIYICRKAPNVADVFLLAATKETLVRGETTESKEKDFRSPVRLMKRPFGR